MLEMVCDTLRGSVAPVLRHPNAFDLVIEQQYTAECAAWSTLIANLGSCRGTRPNLYIADELDRSRLWLAR